ncbi:hypothetical protein F2P45_11460 [Massilia sp. CCM 8733]|uniref:Uncharacterized protein n=1 Tax=Massilia mucilaginosa TaxID=2609282 RepID=A0ABX0NSF1_9BURK|nr:hypothetical protein [Massilia mucilaginosa]NHZ89625.1 hypothetical protein [Massilia mucilaginosa]
MTTPISRPVFAENQILSAADVNAIVSHARSARARHDRYLHSWGIAYGLELIGTARTDTLGPYIEVTVSPGLATDGAGREIVVTEAVRVSEDEFDQRNITDSANDPEQHFYPVFINGRDEQTSTTGHRNAMCLENPSARVSESFVISFGRLGTAAELDQQEVPDPDAPVGSGQQPWRLLLGYVSWNGTRFVEVRNTDISGSGITRRYVGARAGEVTGLGDSLVLRSAPRSESKKAGLVIDNTDGGQLRFGLHGSQGKVEPVFTVNAQGDVFAAGRIFGAIAGGVQVESGVISDGLEVPLPAGITQAQVDDGEASFQIQVQPRYQQPASLPPLAAGEYWLMQPLDCRVDGRRVVCLVRWVPTAGASGALVLPGVCDYVVMGFVKPAEGA